MQSVRPGEFVRRKSLIGFRNACEAMWGDLGVDAILTSLPPEVRERTGGMRPLPDWLPLEDLVAWHMAVWEGQAARNSQVMAHHARLTVDQGFGRVKRVLIATLSPHGLAERVAALWREEYSSGQLRARSVDSCSVELELTNHGYVQSPLMRFIISEVYRHVLGMTRVRNITERHAVEGSSLVVNLAWD